MSMIFVLLLIGSLATRSISYSQVGKVEYPKVIIARTEVRLIKSTFVNQEYIIQIYLPLTYNDTSKHFPVLYLLDADMTFSMAVDIVRWLTWSEEIPQTMIVGISYGSKDWWDNRSRDYTPTKDTTKLWGDFPLAGGAKYFLNFLEKELIPYIDDNFRTDRNERIIAGLSFGGLFATYTLVNKPEMFNKYIISGPGLIWDNKIIFQFEEEYAKQHDGLNAKVYSCVGELDEVNVIKPWNEFSSIIAKRNYKGLIYSSEILKGETHISAWPSSITRGLKYVFSRQ